MTALLDHPPHVTFGRDPGVLREVADPAINLTVWERGPLEPALPAVEGLRRVAGPVAFDWHAPSIPQIARDLGTSIADERLAAGVEALSADIVRLSHRFAAVAAVRHPRVRLARIEDDGCALFHADSLKMRMLCVYAGPGTEWLENENVRREQLGSSGRTLDEATAAIVIELWSIRSIPNWHVSIFKGRGWPGGENNALIHRSAPMRRRDAHRIRLCIDLPGSCGC